MNLFELKILDFIKEHLSCGFLDFLMPLITKLGDAGIFWIAVAVVLLITKKYRKVGAMMGVALVLGLIFGNGVLKNVVGRIRPYDLNENMKDMLLIEALSDKSFPSGHTLASFESAVVLLINDKRLGIPAIVLAALIAFSRLYLYVHYPTDVLASIILGTAFAFLACYIVNKAIKFHLEKKLSK